MSKQIMRIAIAPAVTTLVSNTNQPSSAHVSRTVKQTFVSAGFPILVFLTEIVGLATAAEETGKNSCPNLPESLEALRDFLLQLQSVAKALAILIAVIMLIYAGILLMRGRPEDVEKARQIVTRVLAGLVLVFIASGLVQWAANILCTGGA